MGGIIIVLIQIRDSRLEEIIRIFSNIILLLSDCSPTNTIIYHQIVDRGETPKQINILFLVFSWILQNILLNFANFI